ncbi:fasciclin-like arabinogalactan protein 14 [Tasmannia lanceolata]|uniref:fasciclin-like arabinogalactan protein 14 n=1 Tax=Tasmannia lanceolata TaxID=3420 RepID=UPI0040632AE7
MTSSISPSLFFFLLLSFLFSSATSFNITKMLEQHSDFSTFNSYLTQTQVASQINSRNTITILAVDNSAISAVAGKPNDVLKMIMSVHVVLDYYDMDKLQKLSNKTALLTTLFQSSGLATDQQGFINATVTKGQVALGSAVPGAGLNANLMNSVGSQPYNISVLQISSAIIPPGIDNVNSSKAQSPPPPPAATPKKAPTPASSPAKTPASAPKAATPASPVAPATAPASDAPASDGPTSDNSIAPSPSDSNLSPFASPPKPVDDGTTADAAPAPAVDASSSSRVGASLAVIMGVIFMAAL